MNIDINKGDDMITQLQKEHLVEMSDFIWQVYKDETKRTTPPYKSKADVYNHYKTILNSTNVETQILAYYTDDLLEGICRMDIERDSAVLSIGGPYIKDSSKYHLIANAFFDHIEPICKGFKCFAGTTRTNKHSQDFFLSKNFKLDEDTLQTRVTMDQLKVINRGWHIEEIKEAHFEAYEAFHSHYFENYYWSFEKIKPALKQWKIHVAIKDDKIIGSVFTKKHSIESAEVYGCDVIEKYRQSALLSELMFETSRAWLQEGVSEVLNFVPEGPYLDAALSIGAEVYGSYMCYTK